MNISKTRFINWTRCPMYFPMALKLNPTGKADIDDERERREERLAELREGVKSSDGFDAEDEEFDAQPGPELEALLPYYNKVEEEALKVAKKYFRGTFIANSKDVHGQKLFEYELHGHTYYCYVDIYNENEEEINIIEVKATTNRKYLDAKEKALLDRFSDVGKYPHDLAFQRFVIEHALRKVGDTCPVNYYLAVLNCQYEYDGVRDAMGECEYNKINGQEIIVFLNMNEVTEKYKPIIAQEVAALESYISSPQDISDKTPVGKWCAWGGRTECLFCSQCFKRLRDVPDTNKANNYLYFRGFKSGGIKDKYQLINEGYRKFDDVPTDWLVNANHKIQRDCFDNGIEHIDKEKMRFWLDKIEYPIYHFDLETFPCPLPRFKGETPYRQSVFEFSLHIERAPGVCDKQKDNFTFLNAECDDDEREALVKAIVDHFEFNADGTLHGTMLAQNTSFERGRLNELAAAFPKYKDKLLAICDKSADMIDLLKTKKDFYEPAFGEERAKAINYYHRNLSGSYSIKKTLPLLVPALTYKGMDVGNGVQAYITYLNYDSPDPTFGILKTKADRRAALSRYCKQDTWAMVEILRAVRGKI